MFNPSTSNAVPLVITPEDSTVTIVPYNVNLVGQYLPTTGSVTYGTQVALQINVQGLSGMGTPTGTVTIQEGSTILGSATVTGANAFVPLGPLLKSSLEVGTHTFTVAYSGDTSFNSSVSAQPASVTITQGFINFARINADLETVATGIPLTFHISVLASGTAIPSGTVQVFDNGVAISGPITLATNVAQGDVQAEFSASFAASGRHVIRLGYSGDNHYLAVLPNTFRSSQFFLTVKSSTGAATTTQISQSAPTIIVGQADAFVVTVAPASSGGTALTGTVSLLSQYNDVIAGPVTLENGSASIVVPWSKFLNVGTSELLAEYSGDSNYASSISSEILTTVNPATPSVSLAADSSLVWPGTTSELTVTVQPTLTDPKLTLPFGNVQFYDSVNGAAPQAIGTIHFLTQGNGNFTTYLLAAQLPSGNNVITVQYLGAGNGQWGLATSNSVVVLVKPGNGGGNAGSH
jgi:hypothetical protein